MVACVRVVVVSLSDVTETIVKQDFMCVFVPITVTSHGLPDFVRLGIARDRVEYLLTFLLLMSFFCIKSSCWQKTFLVYSLG